MTQQPTAAPSAAAWWAIPTRVALFALPLAATMPAFSGFPRYEIPQSAAASAVGVILLALRLLAGPAPADLLRRITAAAPIALLFWAVVAAAVTGAGPEAWDSVAVWLPACGAGVWLALPPRGITTHRAFGLGLATSAIANSLAMALQLRGIGFPEAIPFTTPVGAAPRGFFDDAYGLAAFGVVSAAVLTILVARSADRTTKVARAVRAWTGLGALASTACATAVAAPAAWVVLAATMAAAGIAAGLRRAPRHATVWLPILVAISAVGLHYVVGTHRSDAPQSSLDPRELARSVFETGRATPFDEPLAYEAWSETSLPFATDAVVLGSGPGTHVTRASQFLSADHGWTLEHARGLPTVLRNPSALAQLLGEYGLFCVGLLLAVLGAAAARAARSGLDHAAAVGIAAVGIWAWAWLLLPAFPLSAFVLVSLALPSILLTRAHDEPANAPLDSGRLIAGVALVLALPVLAHHLTSVRWGLHQGAGNVAMGHGYLDRAAASYEAANRVSPRFESLLNAGLVAAMQPAGEDNHQAAKELLRAAAQARENDTRARERLANLLLRAGTEPDRGEEETTRLRGIAISTLEESLRREPTNVDVGLRLAQAYAANRDADRAIATLQRLAGRAFPGAVRATVLSDLARIHTDLLENPAAAKPLLEEALPLAVGAAAQRRIGMQLQEVDIWTQIGTRPSYMPGLGYSDPRIQHNHGPGGHDDHDDAAPGHDHEGHDHEGHDHEGHDHEGHDHEDHQ